MPVRPSRINRSRTTWRTGPQAPLILDDNMDGAWTLGLQELFSVADGMFHGVIRKDSSSGASVGIHGLRGRTHSNRHTGH